MCSVYIKYKYINVPNSAGITFEIFPKIMRSDRETHLCQGSRVTV